MTIKTKLIANVLVTATIVIAISLTSYFSMSFLQERLSYLTEQSTPFQLRTIELQRDLQRSLTSLVKVNAARTIPEYNDYKAAADRSLAVVVSSQRVMRTMDGSTTDVTGELALIAEEIFDAARERIISDATADSAANSVIQSMKESAARLSVLDTHISALQADYSRVFETALGDTITFSSRTHSIEELRDLVRELQLIAVTVQNSRSSTAVLIAKGKFKATVTRLTRNIFYTTNPSIKAFTDGVTEKLSEFIMLQTNAIALKDENLERNATESGKNIGYTLNDLFQMMDQETLLARDEVTRAANKQSNAFVKVSRVNEILVTNSQLSAVGAKVASETNRLFSITAADELDRLDAEISSLFTDIQERKQILEDSLTKLNAREELNMLRKATASLDRMRANILSANGIVTALKMRLTALDKTKKSDVKLHTLVIKISALGDEKISEARRDQEQSIGAVNSLIKKSVSLIVAVSSAAIIIGIIIGYLIFRSLYLPLKVVLKAVREQQQQVQEKAAFAEAVADGDLDREVIISKALSIDSIRRNKDEISRVLNAVVSMSEAQVTLDKALAWMTASLRRTRNEEARRTHLKSGLYDLNIILRDELKTAALADNALAFLAGFLGAEVGLMYLFNDNEQNLHTIASYAVSGTDRENGFFRLGEGLPGQVALGKKMICLTSVPPDYLPISSALGNADPVNIVIVPIKYNEALVGVLELGSFRQFNDYDFDFLHKAVEGIAIALNVNRSHQQVSALLEKTQGQTEVLQVQQEELQRSNEVLEERARMLSDMWNDVGKNHDA